MPIQQDINKYERIYFNKIKDILENNGTTIFRNLTTQYNFSGLNNTFGGASEISDGMERVIQSIISEQTDWEIFSLPASSDSSFITPKCVIQIDSKATLKSDGDSTGHKITVGKNQISYATGTNSIIYDSIPFKSNIPNIYNHNIYGNLFASTYFVKLHYDNSNGISTFRDFEMYLGCVPNGLLQNIYGTNIFDAGRVISTPLYEEMDLALYNSLVSILSPEEKSLLDLSYDYDASTGLRTIKEFFSRNGNSLSGPEKQQKRDLKALYTRKSINKQRDTIRVNLKELKLDSTSPYYKTEFDWERYVKLNLI